MTIDTLGDAMSFISVAKMMKNDLPDGQWDELKEIVNGYRSEFGPKATEWPEGAQADFVEDVRDNYNYWL